MQITFSCTCFADCECHGSDSASARGTSRLPAVRAAIAALACMLLTITVGAQTLVAKSHIEVVGGTPESCKDQVERVRATLKRLPVPDNWTFVIACTPLAWDTMARRADALGKTNTGFTNLEARYTFFNGWNFAPRVAAHEVGHILGKTMDDEKADTIGMYLLRQSATQAPHRR